MNIDLNAPLVARREVFIDAPIETVWRVLSDIPRWPAWQPDISSMMLEGALRPGAVFRWKAMGSSLSARVETVDAPRRLGWVSHSAGLTSKHIYMLEAHGTRTRVVTEESLAGWVSRVHKLLTPHFLEDLLEASLEKLKAYVEQQD